MSVSILLGIMELTQINAEGLAALRSAFDRNGSATAGNASGVNDGAAAVVLMSAEAQRGRIANHLASLLRTRMPALTPRLWSLDLYQPCANCSEGPGST